MAQKRIITPLTRQQAVNMAEVKGLVDDARAEVARRVRMLTLKARAALSEAERQRLYDQIRKINDALGDDLDAWAAEMVEPIAVDWHTRTVAAMKKAGRKLGNDVVRFDRKRVETYLRLIHPDNATKIAAVFTDRMTATEIGQLRQAVVEVFRQSSLGNMTANEVHKALQRRWNDVAGSIEFDRFVDSAGRRWTNADYLGMLVRTTTARVARESAIDTQLGAGFDLIRVSAVGDTCPVCLAWDGLILSASGKDRRFPSYQQALNAGLFHPNCDCLHEYVDDAVDREAITTQAAVDNPDLSGVDGMTAKERAALVAEYKQQIEGAA